MTTRLPALAAMAVALLLAAPALAQAPDFGDDTSQWANDGECDDPRFQGEGMTQTPLLEADAMHDATDCRGAFEAGTITLAGGAAAPAAPPVKGAPAASPTPTAPPAPTPPPTPAPAAASGGIAFGDDSSQWARDGECDDRRFAGAGMATGGLTWVNVGHDATDCRPMYESGQIRLWDSVAARAATQCAAIDFGDDTGDFPADGECDDGRFEGLGMASSVGLGMVARDATDCSQYCAMGLIALRDF